jgi:ethanolaminephosphotransferase
MPLWLAPNMITLLGFFFILGNVALLEVYVPDLVGPVRSATLLRAWIVRTDELRTTGAIVGVLQLRFRHVDVSANGPPRPWGNAKGRDRYSTMDNIDGKQARRTGTSSPLGELFEYVQVQPNAPKADN